MSKIMYSQKVVKSGVPERVSVSCPTCVTRHDLPKIICDTEAGTEVSNL